MSTQNEIAKKTSPEREKKENSPDVLLTVKGN
jgi:hypothetical protein